MTRPLSAASESAAPGQRAKVLIVDDSVVARGLFNRWLSEHPGLEIVGSVGDGAAAIKAAARHQPDIVILDLDMPIMDGLTALPEILKISPATSVLVASSLTARSARLSMQCLQLGAVDLQPKPDTNRDLTMSQTFRADFVRKVEGLAKARPAAARPRPSRPLGVATKPAGEPVTTRPAAQRGGLKLEVAPRVLLIGSSTGGPRAVAQVLEDIGPHLSRLPVLIAQHMPPLFTASFAEQLGARTGRTAREALDGEQPMPGTIYVAPGGRHLRIDKMDGHIRLRLDDSVPIKFCRPAVDHLFTDAAHAYGASALGVMLTGMGNDGLDGTRKLRHAGAAVIAQDEATSVVWGMPGAIAKAGLASTILPLDQIGQTIMTCIRGGA